MCIDFTLLVPCLKATVNYSCKNAIFKKAKTTIFYYAYYSVVTMITVFLYVQYGSYSSNCYLYSVYCICNFKNIFDFLVGSLLRLIDYMKLWL